MNILKCYIIEVHQILEPKNFPNMVKVDLTYNCYGSKQRGWHTTTKEEWEKEIAQGYYLG